MGTETIVKPEVLPDIPQTDIARPELETALMLLDKDAIPLSGLRALAQSITITDADTYAQVGAVLSEVRTIRETPKDRLGSFYTVVRRVITFLDTQSNKVKNACTEIEGICLPKMKAYEQKENAATAKEQSKMPEGTTVKPNLPTVSGYRRTTNYYAALDVLPGVTNELTKRVLEEEAMNKLLRAWMKEIKLKNKERTRYLRKFITIDLKALNAEARELKDPKAMMKQIPGIRAWSE